MNEYCLVTNAGDEGTFHWFSSLGEAQEAPWAWKAKFQTIIEYKSGRSYPSTTTFRNEWTRRGPGKEWMQVYDEEGPIPRQGDIFSPPLSSLG